MIYAQAECKPTLTFFNIFITLFYNAFFNIFITLFYNVRLFCDAARENRNYTILHTFETGNFCVRLIFANFSIVIKTRKLIFVNIFAQYYSIWVQLEKCKF